MVLVGTAVVGKYLRFGCMVDLARSVDLAGRFVVVGGDLGPEVVDHS